MVTLTIVIRNEAAAHIFSGEVGRLIEVEVEAGNVTGTLTEVKITK